MSSASAFVLVVEDEGLIRMSLVDELEDAGFKVVEARCADEALEVLKKTQKIDAVFTDVSMPGSMDGLEFAKSLSSSHPSLPVILTSGYLKISINELPQNVFYISKPYDIDQLIDHIRDRTSARATTN